MLKLELIKIILSKIKIIHLLYNKQIFNYINFMIYYTILALLIVLLNCEFDPYRQKLDPKEFEKKILDKLSKYNDLNKRKLSYGNKKYINPTSILTFLINIFLKNFL